MFLGMMLAYVGFLLMPRSAKDPGAIFPATESRRPIPWKLYFSAAIPALCDLTATSLVNIQLLYLRASVWQMLRGSSTIFSSLFCAFVLRRPHFPFMWWSVAGVVVALGIVGLAAVFDTGAGRAGVSQGKTILAIGLTVVAQVVQAAELVIEDFILHDMAAHPLQLLGLKGFWGFVACSCVCLPAVQFLPGTEGNGIHEDVVDTFRMLGNSAMILLFAILYAFFILGYNIGGMLVINVFSAVHRTILEGLRTLCIWIAQIIIHYASGVERYGEQWTRWCFMQMSGFLLLFTSMLMYNKIVRPPCFVYPDEPLKEKHLMSVGAVGKRLLSGPQMATYGANQ
jgi:hypothetical protein